MREAGERGGWHATIHRLPRRCLVGLLSVVVRDIFPSMLVHVSWLFRSFQIGIRATMSFDEK